MYGTGIAGQYGCNVCRISWAAGIERYCHQDQYSDPWLYRKDLQELGFEMLHEYFFDTIQVKIEDAEKLRQIAESRQMNFFYEENGNCRISLDETSYTA